jgi:serine/threonine protein kinase
MKNIENALSLGTTLKSGTQIYKIEKVLGAGGFGITYLASASVLVGNVSIKCHFAIKEHFIGSDCERLGATSQVVYSNPAKERVENGRKDFISEAKRLQIVGTGHNNIVKVNEIFEANNTAYYVMEYLEGESLRSYVKRKGRLTESEMWSTLRPIMSAVNYLHKQNMTHLDVKPDNIMLTTGEDGSLRPVLIDFGLSKHYGKNGKPTSTINTLGCSDGYAPIEQYAGITTFSPTADIYALGATMVFCLTGKDPIKSTELHDGQLVSSLPYDISEWTRSVIKSAVTLQRDLRAQSIASLVDSNGMGQAREYVYDGPSSTFTHKKTVRIDNVHHSSMSNPILLGFTVLVGCASIFSALYSTYAHELDYVRTLYHIIGAISVAYVSFYLYVEAVSRQCEYRARLLTILDVLTFVFTTQLGYYSFGVWLCTTQLGYYSFRVDLCCDNAIVDLLFRGEYLVSIVYVFINIYFQVFNKQSKYSKPSKVISDVISAIVAIYTIYKAVYFCSNIYFLSELSMPLFFISCALSLIILIVIRNLPMGRHVIVFRVLYIISLVINIMYSLSALDIFE